MAEESSGMGFQTDCIIFHSLMELAVKDSQNVGSFSDFKCLDLGFSFAFDYSLRFKRSSSIAKSDSRQKEGYSSPLTLFY